jgi:DNA-binding transcriptional LysR family regulator
MMPAQHNDPIERFFRSGLKLPHLRILVSVAELGQVTRVAAAFHVTQPAISKQIAEIENATGVPIIQRVGNAVELTDIGEIIAQHGRAILRHIELARRDVVALVAGTGGHVRVGAVVTLPEPLIANAVQLLMRRAPSASFSFVEVTLNRSIKLLDDGELDLALGRNRLSGTQKELKQETLFRESFVFVVGSRHPLGEPDHPVAWEDLRSCRWIAPLRSSPAFTTLAEMLRANDIVLHEVAIESSSLALNLALIKSGEFVSILPLSVARSHMMRGTIRVLPLPPLEALGEIVAYWRTDAVTPVMLLFKECLKEASVEHMDG